MISEKTQEQIAQLYEFVNQLHERIKKLEQKEVFK